jgi:hypothetical protein
MGDAIEPTFIALLVVTAQLCLAVVLRTPEKEESGGVESGFAALNTPISPLFGAEALLRRLA